jgi:hypothetical protein
MMKLKYLTYIALVALIMQLTACDDFLYTRPQGVISEEGLQNADGVEPLVIAAYAALAGPESRWDSWWRPTTNWIQGEVRSDNAYKGGGGITDGWETHAYETFTGVYPTIGLIDSNWFLLYCSVQRCNSALRVLNEVSEMEVPDRQRLIGEMKVLRAHYFFELVRQFRKIPYFDENVEMEDYIHIPNDEFTREEILGMIAAELSAAADMLPETQAEIGRVTKYTAVAYQAKVKLYQAYVQDDNNQVTSINKDLLKEVVTLCDQIIASGKYDLNTDFQQLDLVEYENGKESIFSVQYSTGDGSADGGRVNWSNLLNTPPGPGYNGDGFYLPSQNLVNAYQTDANGLPLLDTFNDQDYDVVVIHPDNGVTVTNRDANVDPRLDFTIGRVGIRWKTWNVTTMTAGWIREPATYGYHCSKRFVVSPEDPNMISGWPWGASSLNWQIIRFADVLMWKAEALIEGDGDLDAARQLINRIRRRAMQSEYVKDWETSEQYAANYKIAEYPNQGWDKEYARKALHHEYKLEKALEGERFFDLVRWGTVEQVLNAYLSVEKSKRAYYKDARFTAGKDEYFPIPQAQINFSGGLYKQNAGY